MSKNYTHSIEKFYVGELYLYNNFGNLLAGDVILDGKEQMQNITLAGAIPFQHDLMSRYIDWDNRREYNGFLTIFYKQGNRYTCLHNGISYELNSPTIIDNLVPLTELLPKIDTNTMSKISTTQALNLFDILFKKSIEDSKIYLGKEQSINDYFVGDISLKERTPIETSDNRITYINLPHHIMLGKSNLSLYSYGRNNYVKTVYRCLFLKDGVDLYNLHNHQFYNPHEDYFDIITNFKEYLQETENKDIPESLSIPKALRLFKKSL